MTSAYHMEEVDCQLIPSRLRVVAVDNECTMLCRCVHNEHNKPVIANDFVLHKGVEIWRSIIRRLGVEVLLLLNILMFDHIDFECLTR